eukprot:scaffold33160_cov68-Phaeocystis_antarctica.AAC.1
MENASSISKPPIFFAARPVVAPKALLGRRRRRPPRLTPRRGGRADTMRGLSARPPRRAIARAPRRAARRRRDSATTLLVADPPTALAVTAEGASCAARAVLSDRVSCMLAARRVPTDRVPDGVPGAGRKPNAPPMTNASNAARESCNASAAEAKKFA